MAENFPEVSFHVKHTYVLNLKSISVTANSYEVSNVLFKLPVKDFPLVRNIQIVS